MMRVAVVAVRVVTVMGPTAVRTMSMSAVAGPAMDSRVEELGRPVGVFVDGGEDAPEAVALVMLFVSDQPKASVKIGRAHV